MALHWSSWNNTQFETSQTFLFFCFSSLQVVCCSLNIAEKAMEQASRWFANVHMTRVADVSEKWYQKHRNFRNSLLSCLSSVLDVAVLFKLLF